MVEAKKYFCTNKNAQYGIDVVVKLLNFFQTIYLPLRSAQLHLPEYSKQSATSFMAEFKIANVKRT